MPADRRARIEPNADDAARSGDRRMSDDLVKRIIGAATDLGSRDNMRNGSYEVSEIRKSPEWRAEKVLMECKNHIEALEAENADLRDELAKAVEHFKKLRRRQDCLETFDLVVHEITETALAELTGGQTDE